jgi:hypothetical protein
MAVFSTLRHQSRCTVMSLDESMQSESQIVVMRFSNGCNRRRHKRNRLHIHSGAAYQKFTKSGRLLVISLGISPRRNILVPFSSMAINALVALSSVALALLIGLYIYCQVADYVSLRMHGGRGSL